MMMLLTDDRVLEVFESPQSPPSWIEAIDIENGEYRFCDDKGQRYVGISTKRTGWLGTGKFELRRAGRPDLKNALELVDAAVSIKPNSVFPDLASVRQHLQA